MDQDKVARFKKIYLKHYGVRLTNEQATEGLIHLIQAVKLALPLGTNVTTKDTIDSKPLKSI